MRIVGLINLLNGLKVDPKMKIEIKSEEKDSASATLSQYKLFFPYYKKYVRTATYFPNDNTLLIEATKKPNVESEHPNCESIFLINKKRESTRREYQIAACMDHELAQNIVSCMDGSNSETNFDFSYSVVPLYTKENIVDLIEDYNEVVFCYKHEIEISVAGSVRKHTVAKSCKKPDQNRWTLEKECYCSISFRFIYFEDKLDYGLLTEEEKRTRKKYIEDLCYEKIKEWKIEHLDEIWN